MMLPLGELAQVVIQTSLAFGLAHSLPWLAFIAGLRFWGLQYMTFSSPQYMYTDGDGDGDGDWSNGFHYKYKFDSFLDSLYKYTGCCEPFKSIELNTTH